MTRPICSFSLPRALTPDKIAVLVAGPPAEDAVQLLPDVLLVGQLLVGVEVLRGALDLASEVRHALRHRSQDGPAAGGTRGSRAGARASPRGQRAPHARRRWLSEGAARRGWMRWRRPPKME